MQNESQLILTQDDFKRLSLLIQNINPAVAELLDGELNRATVVARAELPPDVVSMNSKIQFRDLESGKESVITLVFPHEANIEENKISVLAPVGSALIGLKVGQVIEWEVPNGKARNFQVMSVVSQPMDP